MKLILVLVLCGSAAAAHKVLNPSPSEQNAVIRYTPERNWIIDQAVNALIRQLFAFLRRLIYNGSEAFGIPVLDPLKIENFNVSVPAGLVNLELDLENILATGIGGFIVHRSHLNLSNLCFDVDVSVPSIDLSAEHYDFIGELFTAIPLYGAGTAGFKVGGLRLRGKIYLKQSDDGTAIIIDRVDEISYGFSSFKSQLTGTLGGGAIDAVVNSIIDEVLVGYVNRFQGYIASLIARLLPIALNPYLEKLDTWRYLAPLIRP